MIGSNLPPEQMTAHDGVVVGSVKMPPHRVGLEAAVAKMREGVGEPSTSFDDESYPDHEALAMVKDIVEAYHGVAPCPHCEGTGIAR